MKSALHASHERTAKKLYSRREPCSDSGRYPSRRYNTGDAVGGLWIDGVVIVPTTTYSASCGVPDEGKSALCALHPIK